MCEMVCRGSAKISTRLPAVFGSVLALRVWARSLRVAHVLWTTKPGIGDAWDRQKGVQRSMQSILQRWEAKRPSPLVHGSSSEADMTLSGPALHTAWTHQRHGEYAGSTALINSSQGD